MEKKYGFCKNCGQIVYRLPDHQHGNGQVDSNGHPVWLLADQSDPDIDITLLPDVDCGCNT